MMTTWILAGATLGVFLLFAGGAWIVARRTPRRRARRSIHRKMWFLIACGVVFASYAFWADSGIRRTTLHEVILDGAPSEAFAKGDVTRVVEFSVEHPGVDHDLMIGPGYRPPTMRRANFEIRIAATLAKNDEPPLLEDEFTFTPRNRDKDWHPAYLTFTPTSAGPHSLTLRLLTPDIPAVHVRIADPLKTDGQRMPGF